MKFILGGHRIRETEASEIDCSKFILQIRRRGVEATFPAMRNSCRKFKFSLSDVVHV